MITWEVKTMTLPWPRPVARADDDSLTPKEVEDGWEPFGVLEAEGQGIIVVLRRLTPQIVPVGQLDLFEDIPAVS